MRLLRVAGGDSLWADQVDARFADIFSVEDTVTRRVAVALLPQLAGQRASSRPPTSDVEAYEDYLKGRFFWSRRSADGLRTAIAWFQKAIDRDPKFAAAYAGMADSYALLGFYSMLPPSESYPKAQAAALKAIALDDMLAEARASLLSIMTDYNWNPPAAEREFRRTIELNPNYAPAHQWYAYLLVASNHPEQAQAEMQRAEEMDPLSPSIGTSAAWISYLQRHYSQSADQSRKVLDLYPGFTPAHQLLAIDESMEGKTGEAAVELQRARKLEDSPITTALQAWAEGVAGHRRRAIALSATLEHGRRSADPVAYYLAAVYAALEQPDPMFRWLERGYSERSNWMIYLPFDPRFDRYRSDARFQALVERMSQPLE